MEPDKTYMFEKISNYMLLETGIVIICAYVVHWSLPLRGK